MKFETLKAGRWHPRYRHKRAAPTSPTHLRDVLASPGLFLSHLNPEVSRFPL
jgi:hypothetical protein